MQILQRLKDGWLTFKAIPRWRLRLWAVMIVSGAVYLGWCKWGVKPVKPGTVVAAATSPKVADMERKAVTPRKLMVFTPKAEAVKRLKLPAEQAADPHEEMLQATDAPASKYGTTTATFVNMSTGLPRSATIVKAAPWFQFERGNTLGVEVGIGSRGQYRQGDYQRDIFSIKGVVIGGKMAVTSYPSETDWRLGARAEYHW